MINIYKFILHLLNRYKLYLLLNYINKSSNQSFLTLFTHSKKSKFFWFFHFRIWPCLMSIWISIPFLIPLMIIKIISHLPNSLSSWCLIFDWYSCQTSSYVKLYIISIQNIFILIINFNIFITFYSVIVVTCNSSFLYLF